MTLTLDQMLHKANYVAARVHAKQLRKDGTPYYAHPVAVAIMCDTKEEKIVALLHDTIEDTDLTFDDLREIGFTEEIIRAVDSVTKRPYETYGEFILRSKENEIGRVVKIADIKHNTQDQSALDPDEADFLTTRYTKALKVLNA
jgi:(p)ppGpp synthase/HD superfamily hydrolase